MKEHKKDICIKRLSIQISLYEEIILLLNTQDLYWGYRGDHVTQNNTFYLLVIAFISNLPFYKAPKTFLLFMSTMLTVRTLKPGGGRLITTLSETNDS